MLKITGYSDRIYVRPGQTIEFKVNCDGPKTYRADIVRLINGDLNPEGPGYDEEVVQTSANRRYPGRKQVIHAGSHAIVPTSPSMDCPGSLTVQAMIWPTTPQKGRQGLVTRWSPRTTGGFALFIDDAGALAVRLLGVARWPHRPVRASSLVGCSSTPAS